MEGVTTRHSISTKLFWAGTILFVIGVVLVFVGIMARNEVAAGTFIAALFGALVSVVAAIMYFIGWLGALIYTAKLSRWGWFVCILLLGWFAMLAYVFAGPKDVPVPAYAPMQR